MLPLLLALTACASKEDEMSRKLAAAEEAANRAVAAQQAAEKAAATAAAIRPNAPAPEPTVMADTSSENSFDNDDGGDSGDHGDDLSMGGGEGQTANADGVVVPGQGA